MIPRTASRSQADMNASRPDPQPGTSTASRIDANVPLRTSFDIHLSRQSQHRMIYKQVLGLLRGMKACGDDTWEQLGQYGFHEAFAYHGIRREQLMWLDKIGLKEIIGYYKTPILEASTVRHRKTNEQLVLLRVSKRSPSVNRTMVIKFMRNSAKELNGVCHQRVLRCFGILETTHHFQTCLESTYGDTLSSLISAYGDRSSEDSTVKQVINAIVYQTLEGIEFIHSVKKLVHNAITSDTILLTNTGSVKITGFGLCQSYSKYGTSLAPALEHYLDAGHHSFWHAPEIIQRNSCAYQSDIWSLGCLITELWTGERPTSWSAKPRTGPSPKSLDVGELLKSMKSSDPKFFAFVSTMVLEEAEQRPSAGYLLGRFTKSRPEPLNATSTTIYDMITSASDMARPDILYASACVGPPLRDSIAQSSRTS